MIMENNLYINENEAEIAGAHRKNGTLALMIGSYVCDVETDKNAKAIHARLNMIMDRKTAVQMIETLQKLIDGE